MPCQAGVLGDNAKVIHSGIHAGSDKEALASAQAAGAEVFLGQDKDVAAPASKRHKKADRKSAENDSLASLSGLHIARLLHVHHCQLTLY